MGSCSVDQRTSEKDDIKACEAGISMKWRCSTTQRAPFAAVRRQDELSVHPLRTVYHTG